MDNWYADIESKAFTIFKTRMLKKHKKTYPNMALTTDDENYIPKTFPTIYFREINFSEKAHTFVNKNILMGIASFEVEVVTNISKEECRKLSIYVIAEMKSLALDLDEQSPAMIDGDLYRSILRFSGWLDERMFNR